MSVKYLVNLICTCSDGMFPLSFLHILSFISSSEAVDVDIWDRVQNLSFSIIIMSAGSLERLEVQCWFIKQLIDIIELSPMKILVCVQWINTWYSNVLSLPAPRGANISGVLWNCDNCWRSSRSATVVDISRLYSVAITIAQWWGCQPVKWKVQGLNSPRPVMQNN